MKEVGLVVGDVVMVDQRCWVDQIDRKQKGDGRWEWGKGPGWTSREGVVVGIFGQNQGHRGGTFFLGPWVSGWKQERKREKRRKKKQDQRNKT